MAEQVTVGGHPLDVGDISQQDLLIKESTSTDVPWYHADIRDRLKPVARKFFEDYSGIPSTEVVSHISKIVSNQIHSKHMHIYLASITLCVISV